MAAGKWGLGCLLSLAASRGPRGLVHFLCLHPFLVYSIYRNTYVYAHIFIYMYTDMISDTGPGSTGRSACCVVHTCACRATQVAQQHVICKPV